MRGILISSGSKPFFSALMERVNLLPGNSGTGKPRVSFPSSSVYPSNRIYSLSISVMARAVTWEKETGWEGELTLTSKEKLNGSDEEGRKS